MIKGKPISEARLRVAERDSVELARRRPEVARVGNTGRLRRQVPLDAVMNAVNSEGPEVLSKAADGYWADMDRRHPQIAGAGTAVGQSLNGMRNRHGRVSVKILVGRDGVRKEVTCE
jgi:hypothetical protein